MFFSKPVRPALMLLAVLMLAALTLILGYVMFDERVNMLEQGRKTNGIVVGVQIGIKGLRRVEVEFINLVGKRVVGLDLHKTQWFAANDIGDEVTLYFDPNYRGQGPPDILIDRGLWIWSIPLFLLVCGMLLLVLGVYLYRNKSGNGARG